MATNAFLTEGSLKRRAVIPYLLAVFVLIFLYSFHPTELSDNSRGYMVRVATGDGLFYPPHLLYAPIIFAFHWILSSVTSCGILCAGLIHTMLWATIAVVSVYFVVQTVTGSAFAGVMTALLVLVAHGFWVYATQLEVYVPVVGAVTAVSALLLTSRSSSLSVARVIAVSVLWALATMYHLGNVFFCIPLAAYFCSAQGLRGWRQWAIVSGCAGSIVLTTFIIVYGVTSEDPSVGGFLAWSLAITDVPMTDWGSLSHWGLVGLINAIKQQMLTLTRIPEYLTFSQNWLGILLLLVCMALGWNIIQIFRADRHQAARLYLLLWFATSFLFFAWWQPYVHKFYIPSSIPLILLTALAAHDVYARTRVAAARRTIAAAGVAVVVVFFVFNLSSVLELRRSLGPDHAEAAVFDSLAPANCRVYSSGHHLSALAAYFDHRKSMGLRSFYSSFYHSVTGRRNDDPFPPADEDCALIRLGYLSKSFFRSRVDGYLDPSLWKDYIGYFFDMEEDPETGGITYSGFEFVTHGNGPPHVLVDRRRRAQAKSLDELAGRIEVAIDDAVQEYGPELAFTPSADFRVRRPRGKIFGYATADNVPSLWSREESAQ